uniref:Uncharacterized protein n=1 Tax=Arion vulgaris TaxID=1028688 RepID=A0A0B7AIQ6_9EUPU
MKMLQTNGQTHKVTMSFILTLHTCKPSQQFSNDSLATSYRQTITTGNVSHLRYRTGKPSQHLGNVSHL